MDLDKAKEFMRTWLDSSIGRMGQADMAQHPHRVAMMDQQQASIETFFQSSAGGLTETESAAAAMSLAVVLHLHVLYCRAYQTSVPVETWLVTLTTVLFRFIVWEDPMKQEANRV